MALPDMGVSLQAGPATVTGDSCNLRDRSSHLEQPRNTFVSKIMKSQISDSQDFAGTSECGADSIG
jgi:hypothetical protein